MRARAFVENRGFRPKNQPVLTDFEIFFLFNFNSYLPIFSPVLIVITIKGKKFFFGGGVPP